MAKACFAFKAKNVRYENCFLNFHFFAHNQYSIIVAPKGPVTAYVPKGQVTYYIEASRKVKCPWRLLSYPPDCSSINFWNAGGEHQRFTLEKPRSSPAGTSTSTTQFFLRLTGCASASYLSYSAEHCGDSALHVVKSPDLRDATKNFLFRFANASGQTEKDEVTFAWNIEAEGRAEANCSRSYVGFFDPGEDDECVLIAPVLLAKNSGESGLNNVNNLVFHLHAAGMSSRRENLQSPAAKSVVPRHPFVETEGIGAPFIWFSKTEDVFFLLGTPAGADPLGRKTLGRGSLLGPGVHFEKFVAVFGENTFPLPWCPVRAKRWAPEAVEFADPTHGRVTAFFFSCAAPRTAHRIGWVMSRKRNAAGSFVIGANATLPLGSQPGGEIDPSVFRDDDGKLYLTWKSDDNNVGRRVTRLWGQEILLEWGKVALVGRQPRVLLDSTGLWWVTSWVAGGTLIEGPSVIKRGPYYYLFFAAGRFRDESYAEGVARARAFFGPYRELPVPVLSTHLVGKTVVPLAEAEVPQTLSHHEQERHRGTAPSRLDGQKLIGPGHASVIAFPPNTNEDDTDPLFTKDYYIAYRAMQGGYIHEEERKRVINYRPYTFVNRLLWTKDGWPFVDFGNAENVGGDVLAAAKALAATSLRKKDGHCRSRVRDGAEARFKLLFLLYSIVFPVDDEGMCVIYRSGRGGHIPGLPWRRRLGRHGSMSVS